MLHENANNHTPRLYSVRCCVISSHAQRLDTFIVRVIAFLPYTFSRSQLKHHVARAYVNEKPAKLSHKVKPRDEITIFFNLQNNTDVYGSSMHDYTIAPPTHDWNIKSAILYEDEKIIIINKPRGLVVHPGAGNRHNTLAHYVYEYLKYAHYEELLQKRVGIVHRLDKDTTGVIVVAKNTYVHELIAKQFSERKVYKQYIAIVHKSPQVLQGIVETNIVRNPFQRKKFMVTHHTERGKHAITEYKVLYTNKEFSVVLCVPKTGRTHQIRVHMQHLGTPVIGDTIYSRTRHVCSVHNTPPDDALQDNIIPHNLLMLHAHTIAFTMSDKNFHKEYRCTAPLTQEMKAMMTYIGMPDRMLSQL